MGSRRCSADIRVVQAEFRRGLIADKIEAKHA
jgi:hypothetical protein